MRNTADVTGGKPIAVLLQSISGVSAISPVVLLILLRHPWRKERGAILLLCPGHHTRLWGMELVVICVIIISLLISPLLAHRPFLWITHDENGP
jgi:hypothetical protein